MAVSLAVNLTDQPPDGKIEYLPLGGDGYTSPHSLYSVDVSLSQDVSGGVAAIVISRDERFEHLITLMGSFNSNTSAVATQFDVTAGESSGPFFISNALPVLTPGGTQTALWTPPPIINPITMALRVANVDGFAFTLTMLVFNFRIDASKRIPLPVLLSSLPSAGARS